MLSRLLCVCTQRRSNRCRILFTYERRYPISCGVLCVCEHRHTIYYNMLFIYEHRRSIYSRILHIYEHQRSISCVILYAYEHGYSISHRHRFIIPLAICQTKKGYVSLIIRDNQIGTRTAFFWLCLFSSSKGGLFLFERCSTAAMPCADKCYIQMRMPRIRRWM
jgi:hypothetical protein